MNTLADTIQQVYPTITLGLRPAEFRFLAHLAEIAGSTVEAYAESLLQQALNTEAEIMLALLNPPDFDTGPQDPPAAPTDAPTITVERPTSAFITDEELAEMAQERHEITKNQ